MPGVTVGEDDFVVDGEQKAGFGAGEGDEEPPELFMLPNEFQRRNDAALRLGAVCFDVAPQVVQTRAVESVGLFGEEEGEKAGDKADHRRDQIHPPPLGGFVHQKPPQKRDQHHAQHGEAFDHGIDLRPVFIRRGLHDIHRLHVVGHEKLDHARPDHVNGNTARKINDQQPQRHAEGVDH